ncbi:MAG: tRNA (N6-threonylcarbamoyladenosine(37)-N6)-methyltransferase TrmO [Ignavibacteriales bacterium]|nr:tRNA (N6-threonylcarbamoyladenosine(37)-N6)-methyltransferase TrmO [Ignavibacteriales bacterium]
MSLPVTITPIGVVHSDSKYRYESPRQGVLAEKSISVIELVKQKNFEQAVIGLEGFDRIWVVFLFHLNTNWKPMVTPPRHTRKKVGVLATRSPHRPSQIGISCVKLERVEGLNIFISESDILDGSPVLDIKPYLPYSDSFPEAATGWVKNGMETIYTVSCSATALAQMKWLKKEAGINLKSFAKLQLEFNPTDDSRKRISRIDSGQSIWILAYRTWRIHYTVNEDARAVTIQKITSGYSNEELANTSEDKYRDKQLHALFIDT